MKPVCIVAVLFLTAAPALADKKLFAEKVQPMLKAKCLGCHGDDPKLRGGLDLRSREAMLRGGETGPAIVPGSAAQSLLYQAVLRTGSLVMPPKDSAKLTPAETADLKAWIDRGARWPMVTATKKLWNIDPKDAWAFQLVRSAPPPGGAWVKTLAAWGRTPIDALILEKLDEKKLRPAPAADPAILIRRLYFDLLGLPPTPEEVDTFVQSTIRNRQSAIADLIERLLASPHYGERMAQHWLDVVRYADTSGFSNDFERPNAWRYRDYVIRSFNQDKPYDRFILEQIAGDELPPAAPGADAPRSELDIAVGFLRMGPWEHTGMSVAAVTRQMFLDDVTNSIGVTFLGLGLRCARCHDHKFDPIPTRDYYRIQACFAATQFAEKKTPFLPEENTLGFPDLRRDIERWYGKNGIRSTTPAVKDAGAFGMITGKRTQYYQKAMQRSEPLSFSVENGKGQPVAILKNGLLEQAGEVVTPGVLSTLPGFRDDMIPKSESGRRLALARWIASRDHPLTARVIVNRVWQMHFGTGLVATPNNFGKMGGRPSHPELLDWLAQWFMDNGWSFKKLHRLILSSSVYQQSGSHPEIDRIRQIDPNNRLLAYFPPRRMTAEEIRDSMLAVSGELSRTMGGPGVFPEINEEVALQPRLVMGGIAPVYQPSPRPEQRNRRTIYVFRYRTLADPMLEVFNQPGTENSCERRDETTVTPQVFALFNGQFTYNRALALAARLEKSTGDRGKQVELAFRLVLGRMPSEQEWQRCIDHVARMTEHHRQHPPQKITRAATVRRQMLAERTGEIFTWEEQLDTANYVSDLRPWDVGPETRGLAELCLVLLNTNEFVYVY